MYYYFNEVCYSVNIAWQTGNKVLFFFLNTLKKIFCIHNGIYYVNTYQHYIKPTFVNLKVFTIGESSK